MHIDTSKHSLHKNIQEYIQEFYKNIHYTAVNLQKLN